VAQLQAGYSINQNEILYKNETGASERVCSLVDKLAIAYDLEDGILHKHGELGVVAEWYLSVRESLAKRQEMAHLAKYIFVDAIEATEEGIAEINRSINEPGYVLERHRRISKATI
jgi:hypothetical protein